jgi:uncharacterized repeat protein (TIGR01451 family)
MATTSDKFVRSRGKYGARAAVAAAFLLEQAVPGMATIDNTATSTGTYNAGTVTSNTSSQSVPVTASAPKLEITVKSVSAGPTIALGSQASLTDAGDTITYQYTVQNTGNVTLTGVTPVDTGPTFNGVAGAGSWAGAFSPAPVSLNPGATQTFFRTYTIAALDAYRAATVPTTGASLVSNTATATGLKGATVVNSTAPNASKTATAKIDGVGKLLLTKAKVLNDTVTVNGTADKNETVTYTYTVQNVGNAPITSVTVSDVHGDAAHGGPTTVIAPTITNETLQGGAPFPGSADAAINGIYDTLAAGATVTFTYTHTVTQAEVDGG